MNDANAQLMQIHQRLLQIANSGANISDAANRHLKAAVSALSGLDEMYEKELRTKRKHVDEDDKIQQKRLEAAKKAHSAEVQVVEEKAKHLKAINELHIKEQQLQRRIDRMTVDITDQQFDLHVARTEAEKDRIETLLKSSKTQKQLLDREARALRARIDNAAKYNDDFDKVIKIARDRREQAEADYQRSTMGEHAVNTFKDKFKEWTGKVFSTAKLHEAILDSWITVKKTMATGAGLAVKDWTHVATKYGMKPQDYIDMQKEHRRAVLAVGGTANTIKLLDQGHDRYFKRIGDITDTTKFTQEQMSLLAHAGIRPTAENLTTLASSFEGMNTLVGMTGAEFNQTMNAIIADESVRASLQAARSQRERQIMLAGIATRMKENVAMGMTTEQATAAAIALKKMAGTDPLERFRQAAKMTAFAGAMGIQGGDRAGELHRLGMRTSPEQKQELQHFLTKLSNTMSESRMGSQQHEIIASVLHDKLGMDQLNLAQFNTRLAEGVKPAKGAEDNLVTVSDNTAKAVEWLQQIHGAMTKNPLLLAALGGAGVLGAGALMRRGGKAAFDRFGGKLKDRLGGAGRPSAPPGGNPPTPSGGNPPTPPGGNPPGGNPRPGFRNYLGSAGQLAGKLIAPVTGALNAYGEYQESGSVAKSAGSGVGTVAGMAAGAKLGATLGSVVPGYGTAIGGILGALGGAYFGDELGTMIGGAIEDKIKPDPTDLEDDKKATTQISATVKEMYATATKTNDLLTQLNEQVAVLVHVNKDQLAAATVSDSRTPMRHASDRVERATNKYRNASMTGVTGV